MLSSSATTEAGEAMRLSRSALDAITPGAQEVYRQAFERFDAALEPFGILSTTNGEPLRAQHFLAQCLHETGGLRVLVENLNYSAPRLVKVWPSRFPTLEAASSFAHNPRALANRVYGGRMGNADPNDGWRYIGRGLLQLTGRSAYQSVGEALGLNLLGFPTQVLEPEHALRVAGEIWWSAQCNIFADADSIEKITKAINGGLIGLDERRAWLKKIKDAGVVQGG